MKLISSPPFWILRSWTQSPTCSAWTKSSKPWGFLLFAQALHPQILTCQIQAWLVTISLHPTLETEIEWTFGLMASQLRLCYGKACVGKRMGGFWKPILYTKIYQIPILLTHHIIYEETTLTFFRIFVLPLFLVARRSLSMSASAPFSGFCSWQCWGLGVGPFSGVRWCFQPLAAQSLLRVVRSWNWM